MVYNIVFKQLEGGYVPSRCNIPPVVAGALIMGGSALLGSALSGASSSSSSKSALQATRETNETNRQIAKDVNQANYDLYKEQLNDFYEKPSKEVTALREAGLNPALAYSGSSSLPSAAPAQGYQEQVSPYEAYSDTFMNGVINALPAVSDSISTLVGSHQTLIDNQTRDAYNKKAIEVMQNQLEDSKESRNLSAKQRSKIDSEIQGLDFVNRLNEAKYDDNLKLFKLQLKGQELQNRVLDEQNSRDAARLAIEKFEAQSRHKLNMAQISQIQVLSNIAVNTDWRESQSHVLNMNMKALDESLKRLQLRDTEKQNVFNEVMRQTDMYHEGLKSASEVNRWAERAFGLGFRDLGAALRNLISK